MAEIVESVSTFVREYLPVVLGIMTIGVLYLFLDRGMTFPCPADGSAMKRIGDDSFLCPKCGFVKRV